MVDMTSPSVIEKIDELNAEAWAMRDEDVCAARAKNKEVKNLLKSLDADAVYTKGKADSLILEAFLLSRQNDLKYALEVAITAEKICNEQLFIELLPKLFGIIGNAYMQLHVHSLGYQYLHRQLYLAEELNQMIDVASAKHDIANHYANAGKVDVAIGMYNQVTEILEATDDEWFKALTKLNLALTYAQKREFDRAEVLYQSVLTFAKEASHDLAKLFCFKSYSHTLYKKGNYKQALHYLHQKIELSKVLDMKDDFDLNNKAKILVKLKEFDKAETLLQGVLTKASLDLENSVITYKVLGECYAQQAKNSEATEALLNYSRCNEELQKEIESKNIETSELMSDLEGIRQEAEQAKNNNVLLEAKVAELDKLQEEYYQLSIHDALTGIPNRRYITEYLSTTFAAAKRYQGGFGIALIDLDHFKMVNDNFSHQVGDKVLKTVAEILGSYVRQSDTIARFGGEEFILTFKEDSLEDSVKFCERIRLAIEDYNWNDIAENLEVTASFGIASFTTVLNCNRYEDLISVADKKLYESKDKGRNCISY